MRVKSSHRRVPKIHPKDPRAVPVRQSWRFAIVILPCGYALGKQAAIPYRQAALLRAQNDAKERKIATLEYKNQHIENEINSLADLERLGTSTIPQDRWVGFRPARGEFFRRRIRAPL